MIITKSKFESENSLHAWHVTHICSSVIIFSTVNFISMKLIFSYYTDLPSNFAFFSAKSLSITVRSVSQENAFKKSKDPSHFLNSFTLTEKRFRFLR